MSSRGALDGIRVLECGELVAAPYAAKLFGHLGADVVKVEPPAGDPLRRRGPFLARQPHPERGGLHLYLDQAKRGVVIDPSRSADRRRLRRLVAAADVVIAGGSPRALEERGLGYAGLREINPRIVVTTIAPFGLSGPRRDWAATEIVEAAAGGWLHASPGGLRDPALPPLKAFGQQADFQAGVHAAIVTLGALLARERTGRGQHVDVNVQAAIASNLEMGFVHWTYARHVVSRLGQRAIGPWGIIRLADGPFFVVCVAEDHWQRLVDYLGRPEWSRWEIFSDRLMRARNALVLMPLLEKALSHLTCARAHVELQKRRIPCSPIFDMAMLLRSEHLRARGFFVELDHPDAGRLTYPGAPFRFSRTPWRAAAAAPRLGEHTAEVLREWGGRRAGKTTPAAPRPAADEAPLRGVRVADFCWVWAGAACTLQLAHLGAEVVRVEAAGLPDITRLIPPFADHRRGVNRAGYFNQYNQGKQSIGLNLKHADGLALAKRLVGASDVVTENFAAGVMDRIGLGYEELRRIKPGIVMISLSGFGATGPARDYVAYGPVLVPMIGLASLSGYPRGEPSEVGISYGDPNAGLHAAFAVLAALRHQRRTGEGQYVDMSQWEAAVGLTAEALMEYAIGGTQPARQGNRDAIEAPQGVFRCAGDDEWVALACWSDEQWRQLARAMGRPDLAADAYLSTAAGRKRSEQMLEAAISEWTDSRSAEEVAQILQARGVPSYPVLSNRGLAEDVQLGTWGAFADLDHPEVGVRRHVGAPWRFSESDVRVRRPAPLLYADTDAVLRRLLGCDDAEIRGLRDCGAIA
ncbi:MAG: CoA transferase [Deltaproteobacteria bacterium]|nr:CoA transferase [Deltaproteobacteria bacterium]